ncbi:MAG: hypothetical protein RR063_08890 [Anaerovoracaceae bacterium]
MAGLFGGLFDFNHDGKMSTFEEIAEFATFASIIDSVDATEKVNELEAVGIDITELEFMDEDERREAIEDAGLAPEDYDFD